MEKEERQENKKQKAQRPLYLVEQRSNAGPLNNDFVECSNKEKNNFGRLNFRIVRFHLQFLYCEICEVTLKASNSKLELLFFSG